MRKLIPELFPSKVFRAGQYVTKQVEVDKQERESARILANCFDGTYLIEVEQDGETPLGATPHRARCKI
jgi:hypothetical protein